MLPRVFDPLVVPESLDDPPQHEEGGVDVPGLLLSVPGVVGLFYPLGAGQVAKGEHGRPGQGGGRPLGPSVGHSDHLDGEDAVGPGRVLVQPSRCELKRNVSNQGFLKARKTCFSCRTSFQGPSMQWSFYTFFLMLKKPDLQEFTAYKISIFLLFLLSVLHKLQNVSTTLHTHSFPTFFAY